MKSLLFLLAIPAWATTTFVSVDASATQAVLKYSTTFATACTVEVSTSITYLPLVFDVDTLIYSGSNMDSREPYLIFGAERTFVIGKRLTQRDSAGIPRSRALQAATQHFYRVSCGVDSLTGSFMTRTASFGQTQAEATPYDALSPGDPLWPYFDYADKTKGYVDPRTGVMIHRTTGPGDNEYSFPVTWGSGNVAKYPPAGAWTIGGGGFPATITNNNTDYLMLRLDTSNTGGAGGVDFFNFNASASYTSELLVALNNMLTSLTGSVNQPTCNSTVMDSCKVVLCVTVNGVSCHPSSAAIEIAMTTTGTAYAAGDSTYSNIGGWVKPGYRAFNSVEVAKRSGNATCNGTSVVTGGPFNLSMAPGSLITVGATVYTIASIQNESQITLSAACPSGTSSFVSKNFGLLVRAKAISSNTFTLTAGTSAVKFGVAPSAPAGENQDICSFTTVNDVSGNPGYNCFSIGGVIWVSVSTGEGRVIATPWETDATGLHLLAYQMMTFDGTNADIWYGFGNGTARLFKYHYFGDHANIVYPAELGMTVCNNLTVPTNKPCTTQEELTVNGVTDIADLVHAYNAGFDKTKWVAYPVGTNQYHGTFIVMYKRNDGFGGPVNGSYAWIAAFDPSVTTNGQPGNAGCVGGGFPGCIIGAIPAYGVANMRGVNTKGSIQSDVGTGVIQFGPQFTCFNVAINGAGCWKVDIGGGFAFTTSSDPCPTNPYGITGNNCTAVTVTSEPYDPNPGPNETGAPGEYINAAAGDVFCVNIVTVGSGMPYLPSGTTGVECVRLLIKSGLNWTVQRHFQYGFSNSLCLTFCLGGSPTALASTINPALWYTGSNGSAYWDFVNDPAGNAVVVNQHALGSHEYLRNGLDVQGAATIPPCPDTSGCNVFAYSAVPLTPAQTAAIDPMATGSVNPAFAGFNGVAVVNGTQSHPSASGLSSNNTNRGMFYDARPYNGVFATSSGAPLASLVSGSLYKFSSGAITLHRKQLPTHATNGVHVLLDVSGPASAIGTTSTDTFKYCVVLITGECRGGSSAGEIYFNVPYLLYNFCFSPGQATSGADNTDICVHDQSISDDTIIQFSGKTFDNAGLYQRILTAGFATPRTNAPFWNIFMTPASGVGMTRSKYVNNYRADWLSVVMPPINPDSRVRTDFVQPTVSIPASQFTHAMIEFGYLESGSDPSTGKFYCASRAENCRTGGSPFSFASETQTPTACASGCTINLPAVGGRAIYYRVLRTNSGGTVQMSGETRVAVVP